MPQPVLKIRTTCPSIARKNRPKFEKIPHPGHALCWPIRSGIRTMSLRDILSDPPFAPMRRSSAFKGQNAPFRLRHVGEFQREVEEVKRVVIREGDAAETVRALQDIGAVAGALKGRADLDRK